VNSFFCFLGILRDKKVKVRSRKGSKDSEFSDTTPHGFSVQNSPSSSTICIFRKKKQSPSRRRFLKNMAKKIEDLLSEIILDHYRFKKKRNKSKFIRKVKGLIAKLNPIKINQQLMILIRPRKICEPILKKILQNQTILNLRATTKTENDEFFLVNDHKMVNFALPKQKTQYLSNESINYDIPFWFIFTFWY